MIKIGDISIYEFDDDLNSCKEGDIVEYPERCYLKVTKKVNDNKRPEGIVILNSNDKTLEEIIDELLDELGQDTNNPHWKALLEYFNG